MQNHYQVIKQIDAMHFYVSDDVLIVFLTFQVCREEDQANPEGGRCHQQHQQGEEGLLVREVLLVHLKRELPRRGGKGHAAERDDRQKV